MQAPLPIDRHVEGIVSLVRRERAAVVIAPPGTGKTTRIPPALAEHGRTILLQPRRIAARTLTRRIASERGWAVGEEVGWQIRFERRFRDTTRLLVATEGILTARLQSDPLLSDFSFVILDEFHERSIHADLALALVKQAADSRDDLGVLVMSATMDAGAVSQFLGAQVIDIEASRHPVETRYRPGTTPAAAIREAVRDAKGHVLAFLPGVRDIERTRAELAMPNVLSLHGTLPVDEQERALAPSRERKIILATNIAETSLTVDGVTDVVDSGLHKVLRYDAETGVDHLETERISLDSADQRAGRAGRTAPGRATRLWDERDILRPHREPEVRRVDLASPVLDVIAWGGDPKTFAWFERPPEPRIDGALELLRMLGAADGGRLTPLGEQLRRFPLHPRHARVLVEAHGAAEAIAFTDEEPRELTPVVKRILGEAYRAHIDDDALRRALLAGYPDRVAMRRGAGWLLASGTGATLARELADPGGEFLAVLDIRGDVIYRAVKVERERLTPTKREITHEIAGGKVRAIERVWYQSIVLREQQVPPDPLEAQRLLAGEIRPDEALRRRLAFAAIELDWSEIGQAAVSGRTRADDVDLEQFLPWDVRKRLDQLAPTSFPLPSGRSAKLEYREDGSVVASAKLQELFGLAETPRIGPRKTPITFALLAPNGRPVQITQDLRSFWNGAYAEVRKELRGRYPKHPWPDDPWTAQATHRTKRRGE